MSEKTEKATPYKLQKAKEEGQVSKSKDLNIGIFLLVSLGFAVGLASDPSFQITSLLKKIIISSTQIHLTIETIHLLFQIISWDLFWMWLPFGLFSVLVLCLSSMAQTGLTWSFKPLKPDFKRLQIIKNIQTLFSSKTLLEAVKITLLLILIALFFRYFAKQTFPIFLSFMQTHPNNIIPIFVQIVLKFSLELILILLFISIIDKRYTLWKFTKDTRMSKQEIKDEFKQRESDPKIKYKIRQLQQQLRSKTRSLKNVKTATVIIIYPNKVAIALKYHRGSMPAPQVVCKGQGDLVMQIKKIALKNNIPIVENKSFARVLYQEVQLNQWIKSEHYPIAAKIFREIYEI
jgi:flagellar biosynthetic protein FlhB/flagellar biosynthetic protein FliR/FlhB